MTLVEILVVISVISLLLALALPALSRTRKNAGGVKCLVTLRSISQASVIASDGQKSGVWNNVFAQRPDLVNGPDAATIGAGSTAYGISYLMQVRYWQGPLVGVLWEEGSRADVWTCPELVRRARTESENGYDSAPINGAFASYYYSAAMITDPRLWDPGNPTARDRPREFCRGVGMHEVVQPSRKVAYAEVADHHGDGAVCYSPTARNLNVAFADGHAARVAPNSAKPALPYSFEFQRLLGWPDGVAVPFSAAAWGASGVDF